MPLSFQPKSKKKFILISFLALLLLFAGGIFISRKTDLITDIVTTEEVYQDDPSGGANQPAETLPAADAPENSSTPGEMPASYKNAAGASTYNIRFTDSCYIPASVSIKSGDSIRIVNDSSRTMWPASDNHPSHKLYPEFDAKGSVFPIASYTFTFARLGTWGFHDHHKPSCKGAVTVS